MMAIAIFICEAMDMFLVSRFSPMPRLVEAMLDSTILIALLTPIYLLFYRPFWREQQIFSREVSYLSRKLLETVEEERKRISHDLHDQCGQTLTALQFRFDALRRGLPESCTESGEQIKEVSVILRQLSNEIREVTQGLRPDLLRQLGLVAALRSLVTEFSKTHPQTLINEHYDVSDQSCQSLDSEIEVALYRICQECLNNISKHAQAPAVIVRLDEDDSQIILNMGDHGRGFDSRPKMLGNDKRQGIGLLGIRERVADLGGTFNLSTEVGKGTFITVKFPLSGSTNE